MSWSASQIILGGGKQQEDLQEEMNKRRTHMMSLLVWILAITMVILNFLDFKLTYYAVKRGLAKEGNPMMAMFIRMGWKNTLMFKMMMSLMIAMYMALTNNILGLALGNIIFAGICLWNRHLINKRLRMIAQQKREQSQAGTVRVISVEPIGR